MGDKFNQLSPAVQAAVLVVIALALAGFTFWYFALPESQHLASLQRQVKTLKAENDRNEAFKREQTEYLNRIAQLSEQLKTLQSIVPDHPATDVFVRSVYHTGINSDVHIRTFVAEPLVRKDLYVAMPYRLHLDGTYYRLLQFFDRLSRNQRIVAVSKLTLGAPDGGGMGSYRVSNEETVGANCVLTTYYNSPAAATKSSGKRGAK